MPAVLSGDRYETGMTLLRTTYQLGLIAGFGGGAALVAALDPSIALVVDAELVSVGVRPHRPSAPPGGPPPSWWGGYAGGFGLVIGDRRLRTLVGLACVSGFYVVPEGLAVPYAAQIGGGMAAVGWLLAANPAGMVAGMLLLQRLPPERRPGLLGPLALASCLVLVPVVLRGVRPPPAPGPRRIALPTRPPSTTGSSPTSAACSTCGSRTTEMPAPLRTCMEG